MCEVGNIILVNGYKSQNTDITRHSFIVLNTDNGKISGLEYNLVCNVMSSFHDDEQRRRKLNYPGNIEIEPEDKIMIVPHNDLSGYVKAEQLYYFDRNKLDYTVIGSITDTFLQKLLAFIEALDNIEVITDNL